MLNEKWLLTGEGEMLKENFVTQLRPESTKVDLPNQMLWERFDHSLSEMIAIGKANVEISRINAESFSKVADSHVILTNSQSNLINNQGNLLSTHDVFIKSHDKLIDMFKEYLSTKT